MASEQPTAGVSATLMQTEAAEAPDAVRRLVAANQASFAALAERLRANPPARIVTCARGSSDHAASYGKYLIETLIGIPVASAAPSVASVFAAPVTPGSALCIAISQSGRSPDLLATVRAHQESGAYVVAFVNDETSPLAEMADTLIGLKAGPERSVAATKSYITALAAFVALVAAWSQDEALAAALDTLPAQLEIARDFDWSDAVTALRDATNLFVIGRGYSFGIAQEAALKFKETCGLHAEAFSAAEVRHGPMAIVGPGFPILAFATSDTAGDSVREAATEFAERGARICLADAKAGGSLPGIPGHPAIEPILMVQSFYPMANALSLARGHDPDRPLYLKKVTETR
jgi:glutamine---fructose-6-phosphate transaminase (isomerizing)